MKNTANLTSLAKVTDGHMSPSNALIKERKCVTRRLKPYKSRQKNFVIEDVIEDIGYLNA